MVYKKYIKKDGKVFGPYYCESYRDKTGKVRTKFISGPDKKDAVIEKIKINIHEIKTKNINFKLFLTILSVVVLIFLILLIGNFYYVSNITGKIIDEPDSETQYDLMIAQQISENKLSSNVDMKQEIESEFKGDENGEIKIIEFNTKDGKIILDFDLMNSSNWEIMNEDVDMEISKKSEKYKWGYDVILNDFNFIAKITVTSKNISIIDNQTLKIGNNYLSFSDLVQQGYTLSLNEPVVIKNLEDENLIIDILENNLSRIDQINLSIENITNNPSFDSNKSKDSENAASQENENEANITLDENKTMIINYTEEQTNDTLEKINQEETGNVENIEDQESSQDTEEEIITSNEISEVPVESLPDEPIAENPVEEVILNIIRPIFRFFINGMTGMVSLIDGENEQVIIYVQKDFMMASSVSNETENSRFASPSFKDLDGDGKISIGDTINLDPSLITIESTPGNIGSCQELDTAGVYTLTRNLNESDINSTGCFNITASDVELNCNGFYIRNTTLSKSGIYAENVNNITIKNCNVTMKGGAGTIFGNAGFGILFINVDDSKIENCILNDQYTGFFGSGCDRLTIINSFANNNTGTAEYASGVGFYLDNLCDYSNLTNLVANNNRVVGIATGSATSNCNFNNITANFNGNGFTIEAGNNNVFDNIITNNNSEHGFAFVDSCSNNIISNLVSNNNLNGIYMALTSSNNDINNSALSLNTNDVNLTGNSINNVFLNVSYNILREKVEAGSELTRKWYYRSYVVDNKGNILSGASISISDNFGNIFSLSTNSNGYTNVLNLTEYTSNSARSYYSYTVSVSKTGYISTSKTYNISLYQNNFDDSISLNPESEIVGGDFVCEPSSICSEWSKCVNEIRTRICKNIDINCLETSKDEIEKCGEKKLGELFSIWGSDYICGEWSDCRLAYNLENVIRQDVFLDSVQERICRLNKNKMVVQRKTCISKIPVSIQKVNKCSKEYYEVLDLNNKSIALLEVVGNPPILNTVFMLDEERFCEEK